MNRKRYSIPFMAREGCATRLVRLMALQLSSGAIGSDCLVRQHRRFA